MNIQNLKKKIITHFMENPDYIFNVYKNIFIIGNRKRDIKIDDLGNENDNKYNILYYKLNAFNYYEKISSLIFLKDGTIILATNSA